MNGTIFILDNILGTIIISYHFYSASLYNQNGISNWFEEFPLSFRCWSPGDLEKKHRGCLVLPANKAIPDSGEVTGRSCTIEYDLGAICHNRCSCEMRQHPPGAKCQYLLKRNICRQQQCNAGRRRNALQVKRCQVYCSSIHKVIMQYCSSVWCQHGDYACGFFRGSFHEWSWITQTATLCTSNQTSWLYISYLYHEHENQDSSFALNQRLVCALHPVQFPKNSLSHSIGSYALAFWWLSDWILPRRWLFWYCILGKTDVNIQTSLTQPRWGHGN